MKTISDVQRRALLTHAMTQLLINGPRGIVMDWHEGDVADLGGIAIKIVFAADGVISVYEKLTGHLLAESAPLPARKVALSRHRQ